MGSATGVEGTVASFPLVNVKPVDDTAGFVGSNHHGLVRMESNQIQGLNAER